MESITIELPTPPPEVRPNGRPHWRAKAAKVRRMREDAYVETWTRICEPPPRLSRASIRIDWHHKTARFLDRDNIIASCKAYIDGIVDSGLLSDDRDVTYESVGRFKDAKNPRVEITITPTAVVSGGGGDNYKEDSDG